MQKFIRNADLVLRKEHFGGIGFDKNDAITLEFDEEVYWLLRMLIQPSDLFQIEEHLTRHFNRRFPKREIQLMVEELIGYGCVDVAESEDHLPWSDAHNDTVEGCLSAPETVHLSITSKCNLNCPFCYENKQRKEMDTNQILKLIDELSSLKVFQLAIGGGEPLLRGDLLRVIQYCNDRNIVPNLTSNGSLLTEPLVHELRERVGQINISFNEYLEGKGIDTLNVIPLLTENHIKTGVNLLVTHKNIQYIERRISELANLPVEDIVILRSKPTRDEEWFHENKLTREDMEVLKGILEVYQGRVRVDCSLVCLMRQVPPDLLRYNAVYGCAAGIRFCTIKSSGDVFPCSFFDTAEYYAGNVLEGSFKEIWRGSAIFERFRTMNNKIQGACKDCGIRDYCKGCRRIALEESGDFYSQERICVGG